MKNTFFSLVVAVAVAFASSAFAAEAPAAAIKLPAKPGAVTFNHKTHANLKCTDCHASDQGGAIEGFGKTVNKDKAHAKCQECHKKEKKGPQKCADCHKKA